MVSRSIASVIVFSSLSALFIPQFVTACPICPPAAKTLSQEIQAMDAVVIAKLVEVNIRPNEDEVPQAVLEVVHVIRGNKYVDKAERFDAIYYGDGKQGDSFLVMASASPELMWSSPTKLSRRGCQYVQQLPRLPEKCVDRLAFFQRFLEDEDEIIANDAYDEFAKAPYSEMRQLRDRMDRVQLAGWITNTELSANHRRLYLMMLSICGMKDDLPMLEEILRASERKKKAGLDAAIACYLVLRGVEGMKLIEELFLKNKKAEYTDAYAAIVALRFLVTDGGDRIPRETLLAGFRHILDNPPLADIVIPDLVRMKDWTVTEKLVELFKNADEKSQWVRVPVINYLRACPHPEAKNYIEQLGRIDPKAIRRSKLFFPDAPVAAE